MSSGEALQAIDYEGRPGIHTYHECPCGRAPCRGDKCILCLTECIDHDWPDGDDDDDDD